MRQSLISVRIPLPIPKKIHEGNKATGDLKLVTLCYGIIGFIKLLGPYYMLVITERREIGEICGHRVYEVSKSEIISLRNPSVLSNIANSRDKNSYKKLLCMVDLTKDFFFSYSFNIMHSFQKDICETMRVVLLSVRKCLCGTSS
ncbi:unnamed protein product [Brassica rapa subsp. narinosa]